MRSLRITRWALGLASLVTGFGAMASTQAPSLPELTLRQGHYSLQLDGRPWLLLGAQIHNSNSWPQVLTTSWPAIMATHANTLLAPVYWQQLEPAPGHYDYSHIDALLAQTRAHHLHLVLLWFGSWKNGQMQYAPDWIKTDPVRYPRALSAKGQPLTDLSTFSQTNLQADRQAFTALMNHLKSMDGTRHTVVMVQVENEPGLFGAVRDHRPEADVAFAGPVPAELAQRLGHNAGNWSQVFGDRAEEAFQAWQTARYIDQVAAAGKAVYPLPTYVNTWLHYKNKHQPGLDYPSGGATDTVLDVWKAAAPHIDAIGTDLYATDRDEFDRVIGQYHRADNPAFISETGFDAAMPRLIYDALSASAVAFSTFGIDGDPASPADLAARQAYATEFALLDSINRPLAQALTEGRVRTDIEAAGKTRGDIDLGHHWKAQVSYGPPPWGDTPPTPAGSPHHDGHVLLVDLPDGSWLITGSRARVELRRDHADGRHGQIIRAGQGHFDAEGHWVMERLWNGDEIDYGLNFGDRPSLLRVVAGTY
ncbi:DUF5597 domain-containing protein [Frateuria aurantia]|uniref:Beta-galactosidase n=1 Tax=Frateuria aurantia (strain ATCC 33424 / DSM 6220 / KCTC 2777 / LMG 1558 / NBRC 3245 / NCIMB 13370) TaxID=767434 RepID=H8L5J9_FRAAD|nr:DUF5597 domain-containing protein [Frateuria aurantia]AFC85800.1 beta-galactosidase [Frateuria aurantia DSM 6220]